MKLYPLYCGKLNSKRSDLIQDEKALSDPEARQFIPVPAYLIEHPEVGYILYDTGCDPDAMNGAWPPSRVQVAPLYNEENKNVTDRIRDLGIDPDDVKIIILSHLHCDHAGGIHLFKNAERVIVSEVELNTTMKNYREGGDLNAHELCDIKHWIEADVKWETIPEDAFEVDLCDGVKIINFGSGHAWGMLGLMVKLPNSGTYLFTSDCTYLRENIGPPVTLPALDFCLDPDGYRKSLDNILMLGEKYNAKYIAGHDIFQFEELRKKTYWD